MTDNFTGYNANVYDEDGNLLTNVTIEYHHRDENSIDVPTLPEELVGRLCDVVILKEPAPYAFKGRTRKLGAVKSIALFRGHEAEQRRDSRYNTNLTGTIEYLIYDNKKYPLHTPMVVNVKNVSKRGIRLSARLNALPIDVRLQIRVVTGGKEQVMVADVVNLLDKYPKNTEYGCRLVVTKGA